MPKIITSEIGNKATNLNYLMTICPDNIPEFCPLNDTLIKSHLDRYAPSWRELWQQFQIAQHAERSELSEQTKLILQTLRALIISALDNHSISDPALVAFLDTMQQQKALLMIRSTGEEDAVDIANPGGNESIAAVLPDIISVSSAMGHVVASYFSEKSLKQRLLSSQSDITSEAFMPVLLQKMIGEPFNGAEQSEHIVRSGVMYTSEGSTRIQVAPGHGELVVNSKALFDTLIVTRTNAVYFEICEKISRLVPSAQGLIWKENPKALQTQASLPPAIAIKLAEFGRQIEHYYRMPMDIEFVYQPFNKKLYLVQARPIPALRTSKIIPSSIPPAKMAFVKQAIQAGQIQRYPVQVIAPAGFSARIITNKTRLIICKTLEEALTHYLKETNSLVEAVIVRNLAPQMSHEAAQFNSMGIPVVQTDDVDSILKTMDTESMALLVDPQRNQILCLQGFIQDPEHTIEEIQAQNLLEQGLFTQPVPSTTVGYIKTSPYRLFQTLEKTPLGRNIYSELLQHIDCLEAVSPNQSNPSLFETLKSIRYTLYHIEKIAHTPLLAQTLNLCNEIEQSIQRISDAPQQLESLEEHLQLVARLKSFIHGGGNRRVITNTIIQRMEERNIRKNYKQYFRDLTGEQVDYFIQFLKLNHVTFNDHIRELWIGLVLNCLRRPETTQKLAEMVRFYVTYDLSFEFINQELWSLTQKEPDLTLILDVLYKNMRKTEEELRMLSFGKKRKILEIWQQRIAEWANPEAFNALWVAYSQEVIPLIKQLHLGPQGYFERQESQKKFFGSSWSVHSTTLVEPEELLDLVKTDFAYVLSNTILYFVDTHQKICRPSQIKERLKASQQFIIYEEFINQEINIPTLAYLLGSKPALLFEQEQEDVTYTLLTQKIILKTALSLAELMDQSIKSLKGSPHYTDKIQLVRRFSTLLQPCHTLMREWVAEIPDDLFYSWTVRTNTSNGKTPMLDIIHNTFLSLQQTKDPKNLNPSGTLCINAATVGTPVTFTRQFIASKVTLEDLFSLFHQNILMSIAILNQSSQLPIEALPNILQPLLSSLNATTMQLINIEHHSAHLMFEYNYPMREHSAKFIFDYTQNSNTITLRGMFFGHDEYGRMGILKDLLVLEQILLEIEAMEEPVYIDSKYLLTYCWSFPDAQLEKVTTQFTQSIDEYYRLLTFYRNSSSAQVSIQYILKQHPDLKPELQQAIQPILSKYGITIEANSIHHSPFK